MRRPLLLAFIATTTLLAAGCSSDDDTAASAGPTTTASAAAGSTATTTAPSPAGDPAPAGCPAGSEGRPAGVPEGADSKPTLDVDGDGAPDTVWIDDGGVGVGLVFGITTASGATFTSDFDSASGQNARSVLVADVTGTGELIALASDGRSVRLYAVSDCSLVPVQNAQGEQYTFDLGFTGYGTGVGCTDLDGDGVRDLVGLRANDDGTGYTATAVVLDGPRARNSDVTTGVSDAGAQEVEAARSVTCGDLTLARDGVTLGS